MFDELAMAVATGIVEAMASRTWDTVSDRIARTAGRDVPEQVASRAAMLDADRLQVTAADGAGAAAVSARVEARWAAMFDTLLNDHPGDRPAVESLVADLPKAGGRRATVTQQATVTNGNNTMVGGGVSGTGHRIGSTEVTNHNTTKKHKQVGIAVVVIAVLLLIGYGAWRIVAAHSVDSSNSSQSASQNTDPPGGTVQPSESTPTASASSTGRPVPAAAFTAGAHGITGNSTCGDWLASDESTQYASLQRIAVAENSPLASNPFPIQEMKFDCQNNMRVKLARVIWDLETPHNGQ